MKKRHVDIDRAKGVAILLVVFGHVVARKAPLDNEWYEYSKSAVYSFHMAFFMFLSGVVFFTSTPLVKSLRSYLDIVKKRFFRLMPAYIIMAIIVLVGKLIAQSHLHVDNPATGFGDLINIVFFPMNSVASFLWYIYVLFVISSIALAIYSASNGRSYVLIVLGACLLVLPYIDLLGIGQFSKYFLFFSMGCASVAIWDRYCRFVDRYWIPSTVLFLSLLFFGNYRGTWWVLVSILSIVSFHGLCRQDLGAIGKMLAYLGGMTFPIYLFNTISIGVAKAVLMKILTWDGVNFLLFFPILFSFGVLLPIFIKKYILSRSRVLNAITN